MATVLYRNQRPERIRDHPHGCKQRPPAQRDAWLVAHAARAVRVLDLRPLVGGVRM